MATDIRRITFKPGLPLEIEVLPIAATFSKHQESTLRAQRAEFYHVFWFQKGSSQHLVDFQPVLVQPNTLLFVAKDRVLLLDKEPGYDGKLLLFTDNFFGKGENDIKFLQNTILFNDILDQPFLQLTVESPLLRIFNEIETELQHPDDLYHFDLLHNSLHNFLLLAERLRRRSGFIEIKRGADLDYTLLFKTMVEVQFTRLKTVSMYARQMAVTEKRLTQATTATLGKTPKAVIDERIILESKRLLAHTAYTIKEIGYSLGFEEPTNFIKFFRKHADCTPIEFRERHLH